MARKTKSQAPIKPEGAEKIRFSEQELSQMGMASRSERVSIQTAFREKYSDKFEENENEKLQRKSSLREKKSTSDRQNELYNKEMPKTTPKQERADPNEMSLEDLSSVRLGPQYLPVSYLKQAQKIFHKYGQTRLREIANNFSQLMNLRYKEEKINFDHYQDLKFNRLQEKLPTEKQVEQIYLIGEDKIYQEKEHNSDNIRKIESDPFNPEMNYTQNIVISYLLNRAPRSFATAIRLMTEIKYKYPSFKPKSFLDFGAGLSAGSCAFSDIFENVGETYSVEPSAKMRKLSKYLTEGIPIRHFESLGEMSTSVREVDIVYAGYVLNELKPDLVEVYLEALYTKTKNEGFLVLVEYGSPFGSRLIHEARKWAIEKGMYIAAPCPHSMKCPLASSKSWCHFDQPSGIYPQNVFGKLPIDHAVKYEKFSYLILQKKEESPEMTELERNEPNITKEWDRVIYPLIKRGRHILVDLCTKEGTFERRITAKSHGPHYKEVKKLRWGDYWRFGKRIPNRYRKERKTGKRLW